MTPTPRVPALGRRSGGCLVFLLSRCAVLVVLAKSRCCPMFYQLILSSIRPCLPDLCVRGTPRGEIPIYHGCRV
jgi:hypothetical protein